MVRGKVDYQKGVIYTIKSGDSVYVGSTTNFRMRKSQHKSSLKKNKQFKLYKTIRENNGEWEMKPFKLFPCNSTVELQIEEERVRRELHADLNMKTCYGIDKEKQKQTKKERDQRNKEQINEYSKVYYQQNREQLLNNKKERDGQNREHILKYEREYRLRNRERLYQKYKEYRLRNREKLLKYKREYRLRNKEKISKQRKERYQRKKLMNEI